MSQLTLPARPEAGAMARRAVSNWLGEHPRLDDALLALTELVNNAVLHGGLGPGEHLTITMTPEHNGIRLTVRHVGVLFNRHRSRSSTRDAGASRGLAIVEQIADGWGVDSDGSEVTAWFEVGQE
ncbi:MAG TPA: ATP-binding protein [Acidimicrobiia bacterium]|nr:ATP-binding protein [Acidimicrobiia bacterium]